MNQNGPRTMTPGKLEQQKETEIKKREKIKLSPL